MHKVIGLYSIIIKYLILAILYTIFTAQFLYVEDHHFTSQTHLSSLTNKLGTLIISHEQSLKLKLHDLVRCMRFAVYDEL